MGVGMNGGQERMNGVDNMVKEKKLRREKYYIKLWMKALQVDRSSAVPMKEFI